MLRIHFYIYSAADLNTRGNSLGHTEDQVVILMVSVDRQAVTNGSATYL